MRWLLVVLCCCIAISTAPARAERAKGGGRSMKVRESKPASNAHRKTVAVRDSKTEREPSRSSFLGQSIGAPANGRLVAATLLRVDEGAHIRRPERAWGTRTTVGHMRRVLAETRALHPRSHVLAIGDLSAKHGGPITQHASHQSGRDVDLGLFYNRVPKGYPAAFIAGTEENLDAAPLFTLLSKLLATAGMDGGVKMIFLDYEVQGILYRWGKRNGINTQRLEAMFEYPDGIGSGKGLIRHIPAHADHLHVRFHCAKADRKCW